MMRRGPRAMCPLFRARVDWRGRSYILCGSSKLRYLSLADREEKYKAHCCCSFGNCRQYRKMEG